MPASPYDSLLREIVRASFDRRSDQVFSSFSTFLGEFTATVMPAKQGSGFETSCMTVSPGWGERERPVAGTWPLFACAGGGGVDEATGWLRWDSRTFTFFRDFDEVGTPP